MCRECVAGACVRLAGGYLRECQRPWFPSSHLSAVVIPVPGSVVAAGPVQDAVLAAHPHAHPGRPLLVVVDAAAVTKSGHARAQFRAACNRRRLVRPASIMPVEQTYPSFRYLPALECEGGGSQELGLATIILKGGKP